MGGLAPMAVPHKHSLPSGPLAALQPWLRGLNCALAKVGVGNPEAQNVRLVARNGNHQAHDPFDRGIHAEVVLGDGPAEPYAGHAERRGAERKCTRQNSLRRQPGANPAEHQHVPTENLAVDLSRYLRQVSLDSTEGQAEQAAKIDRSLPLL